MLDLKVIMGIGCMFVVILMTFSVVKIGKKNDNDNVNDNFFMEHRDTKARRINKNRRKTTFL